MRVIKFPLKYGLNRVHPTPGQHISFLYMDFQADQLQGWFLEEPFDDDQDEYEILIAHTGEEIPDNFSYLGSAQTFDRGYYVVHAFH